MPQEKTRHERQHFLLGLIAKEFPDLVWKDSRYIDEGWDHEVIILDEKTVFRFPTAREYKDKLKSEIAVLDFLSSKIAVSIPRYTHVASNHRFAGYTIVPGVQLTKEVFDSFETSARISFATQLAGFLSTIHALPPTKGALALVGTTPLEEEQAGIKKQAAEHLKSQLDAADYRVVETILAQVDDLLKQRAPSVFIHNDLYSSHIIWESGSHKVGIIDFSDMCIGDPAVDFAELHEFGSDFVKQVYDMYTGPKDTTFIARAWTYQQWAGVYMMTDHFENHRMPFAEARKIFDRVKNSKPGEAKT